MNKRKRPPTAREVLQIVCKRLDDIEHKINVIEERQITLARTLAPLVYDLRNGGWHIPSSGYEPDDITDMVRKYG